MKLLEPTMEYEKQILDYREAFLAAGNSMDGCGNLRRFDRVEDWLAWVEATKRPETTPEDLIPSTQLIAVRETDGAVVGMLQIRHTLNDYTAQYAGHIGYSVRPDERRKGYATRMLRDALPLCRELELRRVLVLCRVENEASRRVILKNGGVYEGTVREPRRNVELERYWIDLGQAPAQAHEG